MHKYFAILKIGFKDALEYRTEFFISFFGWLIRLMISIFLFIAVFQTKTQIGGFDLKETILYFVVVQMLISLIFSRIGFVIGQDIQKGDLSNYLIKPVSYIFFQIARQFSRNIMQIIFGIIFFFTIFLFLDPSFFLRLHASQIGLGLFSVIFAYITNISLVTIIGLSAFWITNSSRLIFMFYAILSIFSGLMIPLNFFPEQAQQILFNTPFPYVFYVPAQIFLGHIEYQQYLQDLMPRSLLFVAIELTIISLIYRFGIKKYEAVGR